MADYVVKLLTVQNQQQINHQGFAMAAQEVDDVHKMDVLRLHKARHFFV